MRVFPNKEHFFPLRVCNAPILVLNAKTGQVHEAMPSTLLEKYYSTLRCVRKRLWATCTLPRVHALAMYDQRPYSFRIEDGWQSFELPAIVSEQLSKPIISKQ